MTKCATCESEATVHRGPFHFCQPCSDASQRRSIRNREILRQRGQQDTDLGRALGA